MDKEGEEIRPLRRSPLPNQIIMKSINKIFGIFLVSGMALQAVSSCGIDDVRDKDSGDGTAGIEEFTLYPNTDDPLIAKVSGIKGLDIEVYGEKQSSKDNISLEFIKVSASDGSSEENYIFFDERKRISKISSDGISIEFDWITDKTAVADYAFNGQRISRLFWDLEHNDISEITESEYQEYRHLSRCLRAGGKADTPEELPKTLTTHVYCGDCPVDNAEVFFEIQYSRDEARIIPATPVGEGKYVAEWTDSRESVPFDDLCSEFLNAFKDASSAYLCANMGGMLGNAIQTGCIFGVAGLIYVSGGVAAAVAAGATASCVIASTAAGVGAAALCYANIDKLEDPECNTDIDLKSPAGIKAVAKYQGVTNENTPLIDFVDHPAFPDEYEYPDIEFSAAIAVKSGNGQTWEKGKFLPEPLVVGVQAGSIAPEGFTVEFSVVSGGGSVTPEEVPLNGQASARWLLGSGSTQTVEARVKDCHGKYVGDKVTFNAKTRGKLIKSIAYSGKDDYRDDSDTFSFEYDETGRLSRIVSASFGKFFRYSYEGNRIIISDEYGPTFWYETDSNGYITSFTTAGEVTISFIYSGGYLDHLSDSPNVTYSYVDGDLINVKSYYTIQDDTEYTSTNTECVFTYMDKEYNLNLNIYDIDSYYPGLLMGMGTFITMPGVTSRHYVSKITQNSESEASNGATAEGKINWEYIYLFDTDGYVTEMKVDRYVTSITYWHNGSEPRVTSYSTSYVFKIEYY